jgi:hypothetical protein
MDFAKFILLMDKKALYFQPLKKLKNDTNEGNSTQRDILEMKNHYEYLETLNAEISAKKEIANYIQKINRMKWLVRVNCWHINEGESMDMWNNFCKNGEGVAIQSTFKRLKESFIDNKGTIVHIGKINYVDYKAAPYSPYESILVNALQKELFYQSEKELRILISKMPLQQP